MTDDARAVLDEILLELRALRLSSDQHSRDLEHLRRVQGTIADEVGRLRHPGEFCQLTPSTLLAKLRVALDARTEDA